MARPGIKLNDLYLDLSPLGFVDIFLISCSAKFVYVYFYLQYYLDVRPGEGGDYFGDHFDLGHHFYLGDYFDLGDHFDLGD